MHLNSFLLRFFFFFFFCGSEHKQILLTPADETGRSGTALPSRETMLAEGLREAAVRTARPSGFPPPIGTERPGGRDQRS